MPVGLDASAAAVPQNDSKYKILKIHKKNF